jgi:ABC-type multidrug transport system fused ATPase/permease subunit
LNAKTPNNELGDLLRALWRHLSRRRQRQFVLVTGLMVVGAFAEVVSLGAILPFIGILVAPDRVFNHPLGARIAQAWGITSPDQLVWPLTVAFALVAIGAGAIRTLVLWCTTRLSYASGAEISMDVYRRTLYQPYQVHVARNSSVIISGITTKVHEAVNVLYLLLTATSSALSGLAIVVALIAIDPLVAAVATLSFGASYGLTTWLCRRSLRRNSHRIAYEQTQLVKAIQEGLGGIRDVLLDGTQSAYCDIYRHADRPLRRAQGSNIFIAQSPRFIIETFGMVLIAALAYGLTRQPGGVATALPVLGALALGAQRLLPILQIGYSSWAGVVSSHGSLTDTVKLLEQPLPPELSLPTPAPLPFRTAARFDAVRFRYTADGPWVLDDFNLTIRKGCRVGLVGTTGSGKSTALDLLMGLLTPTEGAVLVDGQPVTGNIVRAWQRAIAHVPQSIYLTDATLAENIAFGVPREAIDRERLKRAASQAQIADFIEGRDGGYDTVVGERGVRLSGGQRQRIGIARALYKQASVLVFDEATSALDNATEQSVMDAIEGLDRDLTIVLIAHRLTTVRRCDIIVELQHGRVVAQGTYEQLLQSSPSFRSMARATV